MAGSLWSGLAPATAQSRHQTPPSITATGAIDDAVQATRSARFARYGADVTVGAATITATGSVDLVGDRIRTDVRADGKATEFRRAGGTYYVDAQRLGVDQAARLAVMLPAPKRFEKRPASDYVLSRSATIAARMGAVELP